MKINKLVLNNFSSFEGVNVFDLSTTKRKNIILIGGKNGAGKTSLFSAIKIALYGPMAFGYVGANNYYTVRIKEHINSKAFQADSVQSGVSVEIEMMVDREVTTYEIERKWTYKNQKFDETVCVTKNGFVLEKEDEEYFHNYLMTVIPPSLFDFFLFDGEEVGNIFSTSTYNAYVKKALFTMCGMDVYETIRKYTASYVSGTRSGNSDSEKKYEELLVQTESLSQKRESLERELSIISEKKDDLDVQLEEIETAFLNAGGITEKERAKLDAEFAEGERIKQECSTKIKSFVEGLMPFYIVKEFSSQISMQIESEDKAAVYNYVRQKLDDVNLKNKAGNKTKLAAEIKEQFIEALRPDGYVEGSQLMHDLSKTEASRVNALISSLSQFDENSMIDTISVKQKAVNKNIKINKKLKKSMADEERQAYLDKENRILKEREKLIVEFQKKNTELESTNNELEQIALETSRVKQQIMNDVQRKHVYELSSGISRIMESVLESKAVTLRQTLETQIVENLRSIYRKNNLITHIEIDPNYQINLFQDEKYTRKQLLSLINNVGEDEFVNLIGNRGKEELFEKYKAKSIADLLKKLKTSDDSRAISSYKRIEMSRLSRGERQIFILSLYWAVIKLSGQDIPFVIDTPYARIDANHREEISKKYFPAISKQVVVLSTDEEINEEYYSLIKPHIAREYLLTNDEVSNKTSVSYGYFF